MQRMGSAKLCCYTLAQGMLIHMDVVSGMPIVRDAGHTHSA